MVLVQDAGNAQVIGGLGVLLAVVDEDGFIIGQVVLLHEQGVDLRVRFAHMHITGDHAAVKQREEIPVADFFKSVGGHVGKVVQAVSGQFQLARGLEGALVGLQDTFPFVDDRLNLKGAAAAGGVFQHDAVCRSAGKVAPVHIFPLFAAEGQCIHDLFGLFIHKTVHQKILGGKVDDDPAQIKDDVLVHS